MEKILIDTRIWSGAIKYHYLSKDDPDIKFGFKAKEVLKQALKKYTIMISSHLVSEIFHVLTMRGRKISKEVAKKYIVDILKMERILYRDVTKQNILRAMDLSKQTGIHIWDFLIYLPFEREVEKIVTTDPHFNISFFKQQVLIENPIGIWKKEG